MLGIATRFTMNNNCCTMPHEQELMKDGLVLRPVSFRGRGKNSAEGIEAWVAFVCCVLHQYTLLQVWLAVPLTGTLSASISWTCFRRSTFVESWPTPSAPSSLRNSSCSTGTSTPKSACSSSNRYVSTLCTLGKPWCN